MIPSTPTRSSSQIGVGGKVSYPNGREPTMAESHTPRSDLGESTPLVPPLYQSSVYTLPDLDALDRIMNAEAPGFIYFRDGHPNAKQLADRLAALEGATWAVACVSGMAAVAAAVLAHVQQGE